MRVLSAKRFYCPLYLKLMESYLNSVLGVFVHVGNLDIRMSLTTNGRPNLTLTGFYVSTAHFVDTLS